MPFSGRPSAAIAFASSTDNVCGVAPLIMAWLFVRGLVLGVLGHHEDEIRADALHLPGDLRARAVAQRHERHHRCHADDDAEHRQQGAPFVRQQAVQRLAHQHADP